MKKLTTTEFIEKAKSVHGDLYDYSKTNYINSRTKVCIVCPIHGEFYILPLYHLNGKGCSKCSKICYDTESFIEKAKQLHKEKYLYDKTKFINTHTKVTITCPEHGDFYQLPLNHLYGRGCTKCKYKHQGDYTRSNTQNFIKKASSIHNNFYDYSKVNYISNRSKILITCPKHGDFLQEPHEHLAGYGCRKCICKGQTLLFNKLVKIIPDLQYEVTKLVVPWLQSLRFDMYSSKYNIAIEYDGPQHFKAVSIFGDEEGFAKTKIRDSLKEKLCVENNCKLFRIKYNYTEEDFNNLVYNINLILNLY